MDRFYSSKAWRDVRAAVLDRDGRRCMIRADGCQVEATQVDHIIPRSMGGAALDPSNLRASCGFCNASRTRATKRATAGGKPGRPSREW